MADTVRSHNRPMIAIGPLATKLLAAGVPAEALGNVLEIVDEAVRAARPPRGEAYRGIVGKALASERQRVQPQQIRVKRLLGRLYGDAIPGRDVLSDGQLIKEIQDAAQADGLRGDELKRDTILRAAHRRAR